MLPGLGAETLPFGGGDPARTAPAPAFPGGTGGFGSILARLREQAAPAVPPAMPDIQAPEPGGEEAMHPAESPPAPFEAFVALPEDAAPPPAAPQQPAVEAAPLPGQAREALLRGRMELPSGPLPRGEGRGAPAGATQPRLAGVEAPATPPPAIATPDSGPAEAILGAAPTGSTLEPVASPGDEAPPRPAAEKPDTPPQVTAPAAPQTPPLAGIVAPPAPPTGAERAVAESQPSLTPVAQPFSAGTDPAPAARADRSAPVPAQTAAPPATPGASPRPASPASEPVADAPVQPRAPVPPAAVSEAAPQPLPPSRPAAESLPSTAGGPPSPVDARPQTPPTIPEGAPTDPRIALTTKVAPGRDPYLAGRAMVTPLAASDRKLAGAPAALAPVPASATAPTTTQATAPVTVPHPPGPTGARAQVDSAPVGPAQVSPARFGPAQFGSAQVGPAHIDITRIDPPQAEPPALPASLADIAPLDRDVPLFAAPRTEVTPESRPATVPPTTETAQRIATQIAARLTEPGGTGFDLALDPEELGKVRLRLVSHEGGSLLIVQAERPETLDLMRRNIATLESDLRALGHDQLSLRFSGGGQGQGGQGQGGQQNPGQPPGTPVQSGGPQSAVPSAGTAPDPRPRIAARDRIDLRL